MRYGCDCIQSAFIVFFEPASLYTIAIKSAEQRVVITPKRHPRSGGMPQSRAGQQSCLGALLCH